MYTKGHLRVSIFLAVSLLALGLCYSYGLFGHWPQREMFADKQRIISDYGKLPLSFIENQGQADARVSHYIQSPGRNIYFTDDGYMLRLNDGRGAATKTHNIKVELLDAATERIEGRQRAEGIVRYFKGEKESWKTDIPTHSRIQYVQPWQGIDLAYEGKGGKLESVYSVAPYANPNEIKLRYSGQESLTLDEGGNLVYSTPIGDIKETAPIAWQEVNGERIPVKTSFRILENDTVSFDVEPYDTTEELIIDPTLVYATYLGGSADDRGAGIAVDSSGNVYLSAQTSSTEGTFPDTVGPDTTFNGGNTDVYVAKLNSSGTALSYAGYIGGSGDDYSYSIAVDSSGNAYIAGDTSSTESSTVPFPVTVGPDTTHNGGTSPFFFDGFVAKVNSAGTGLTYAGFIGGSGNDSAVDIAVDTSGNAYVIGSTESTASTFPVTVGPSTTYSGNGDVFLAKVNSSGSALSYAGYVGGAANDDAGGIAVDTSGNAYITGLTASSEATFPVTVGPDLTWSSPNNDAFVAKVNSSGTALIYAGYIGGGLTDEGYDIAVDNAGSAYITGRTASGPDTFPAIVGPDLSYGGVYDAFVAKVKPGGTGLVYAGYIGGTDTDYGRNIAVDSLGSAYVSGQTSST